MLFGLRDCHVVIFVFFFFLFFYGFPFNVMTGFSHGHGIYINFVLSGLLSWPDSNTSLTMINRYQKCKNPTRLEIGAFCESPRGKQSSFGSSNSNFLTL